MKMTSAERRRQNRRNQRIRYEVERFRSHIGQMLVVSAVYERNGKACIVLHHPDDPMGLYVEPLQLTEHWVEPW
jgi:hypothetical protein